MTAAKASKLAKAPTHTIQARVYYEDTDAGGIVYHARFLHFAERGRTEYLRALGYDHHQVRAEHNLMLVVRHAEIDYRASGKLDDLLDITTEVVEFGNTSLTMKQTVSRAEEPAQSRLRGAAKGSTAQSSRAPQILADMKIVVVAVSGIGKAVRIPPQLRQIFGQ